MSADKDIRQQAREILKLFKLTDTYGINSDLAVDDIMQLIAQHDAALKQKLMEAVGDDERLLGDYFGKHNTFTSIAGSDLQIMARNIQRTEFREAIQSIFEEEQ